MIALFDTPLMYLAVFLFQKKFKIKDGEEINID
jgi:hypothetical protein